MTKKLYRSRQNKLLAGVAGGIAEYFDIDPVIVRALFVVSTIGWGISLIAYLVLWIIVPINRGLVAQPCDLNYTDDNPVENNYFEELSDKNEVSKRKIVFGIALIIIGLLMLLDNILPTIYFSEWWPIVLVAVGIYFLSGTINKTRNSDEN